MGIDVDDYYVDPYDVYMDDLTKTERNRALEPKQKRKVRWWWWLLWAVTFPYSFLLWPVLPIVIDITREVIRHKRKPRV